MDVLEDRNFVCLIHHQENDGGSSSTFASARFICVCRVEVGKVVTLEHVMLTAGCIPSVRDPNRHIKNSGTKGGVSRVLGCQRATLTSYPIGLPSFPLVTSLVISLVCSTND